VKEADVAPEPEELIQTVQPEEPELFKVGSEVLSR